MHRYRTTRSWTVSALALAAAGFAVVVSGGLSAGFGAAGALAPRLARSVEGARLAIEAQAATAPSPARAARPAVPAAEVRAWQIQVGALRTRAAAEALLAAVAREVPELANLPRASQASGPVTRARFAGIADESAAERLCANLSYQGRECFIVPPRG